jgi:glycosyltransferase involved in cell wall biosynthesis
VEATRLAAAGLPRPDEVEVPGWLGPAETRDALASSAVFCLPSKDEGLPVALLEAMAHGLACVVTPVGGMPEAVDHAVNGLLVRPGDVNALASALERVLTDRELRLRLGDRARRDATRRFAVDVVIGRLEELYASLGVPPMSAATVAVGLSGKEGAR